MTMSAAGDSTLNFIDWVYLTEGSAHLILKGTNGHAGMVLRIPKRHRIDAYLDASFLTRVMRPVVGTNFIPYPLFVNLMADFIALLVNDARLNSYMRCREWDPAAITVPWTAELLPNFHFHSAIQLYVPRSPLLHIISSMSVEFKVKGGLCSSSPFLGSGASSIKREMSRFALVHYYKFLKAKPLGSVYAPPQYSPSDLCSRDKHRIDKAIRAMMNDTGSHFSVYTGGSRVFRSGGDGIVNVTSAFSALMRQPYHSHSLDDFISILSGILHAEEALYNLEILQSVDMIELEGCGYIWTRLVMLVGSEDEALTLLHKSRADALPFDLKAFAKSMRKATDDNPPSKCIEDDPILANVISELWSLRTQPSDDECIIHEKYSRALNVVDSMGIDECVVLLRLWLIALTAKDTSIVISLVNTTDDSICNRTGAQPETRDGMGTVQFLGVTLAYQLRVLDVNCKPAEKVASKQQSEQDMCEAVSKSVRST